MKRLSFTIPETLPPINVLLRMHWAKRRKLTEELAWMVRSGLQQIGWRGPLIHRCRISVKRYSTREPDVDAKHSTAKMLLDVLQPHSKRHPFGLGVIVDDTSKCIELLTVEHVARKLRRTDVEIESLDEPIAKAA